MIAQVRHILGTDTVRNVILVGAGNLGRALSTYEGFHAKGFVLVAVFDNDPAKLGRKIGDFHSSGAERTYRDDQKHSVQLAVLAVPADNAQDVADELVGAGIRGLLNFAPVSLSVPSMSALNSVDLAVQLKQLSFQVNLVPAGREPVKSI